MKNQNIFNTLESLTLVIGRTTAGFSLLIMLLTFMVVIMRYGFHSGELQIFGWSLSSIAIDETVIYLHAALFMLASAATLRDDAHVRVDVFYRKFSSKNKSLINILGTLLLLFPMCAVILWSSLDYVKLSWQINEHSQETEGLPYLFILKGLIPTMAVLLFMQGLIEISKHALHLAGKAPYPFHQHEDAL
ncbi:MAG: permease [Gammaproteobacteria bacterium]|nr:MAG: permease [Gammaproteobacteria bacterium]